MLVHGFSGGDHFCEQQHGTVGDAIWDAEQVALTGSEPLRVPGSNTDSQRVGISGPHCLAVTDAERDRHALADSQLDANTNAQLHRIRDVNALWNGHCHSYSPDHSHAGSHAVFYADPDAEPDEFTLEVGNTDV